MGAQLLHSIGNRVAVDQNAVDGSVYGPQILQRR